MQDRFCDEDHHARHLFYLVPSIIVNNPRELSEATDGMLKIRNFFFALGGGGEEEHGSGPLAPEARGYHSTCTPLALKVTRILYNPPFDKFLDPPLAILNLFYTLLGRVYQGIFF